MLRLLLVAAAASLAAAAPAAAQPVTRPALPGFCRDWGGDRVVALACDPGREARQIDLRLGTARARATHTLGVGQFDGAEPLQPGETVTLRWTHPSPRAVLAVWSASVQGPHMVVLDLRSRPESVEVAAQAAGALQITTPAGTETIGAPSAPADVVWRPRTARAAATQLLSAMDRLESSPVGVGTLCAALDRDVFAFFDQLLGDPSRYPCPSGMTFMVFGDENVPHPTATVHRGSALAVHGGRAQLRTRLTHRYRQSSTFDSKRLVVDARVLLVRDAQGIWRLATVDPLLPLVAVEHRRPFTDAELDHLYRSGVRAGRKAAAAAARLQAQRAAATADGSAPTPCSVALRGDPVGDVVVQESDFRARDQRANAGLDIVGVGAAGRCVALRTAGPLPASFEVQLLAGDNRELRVTVAAGRVLVEDVTEDATPKPLQGAAAHLDTDGLVLSLPAALAAPIRITLEIERDQVSYGDGARLA
jgi:hypothetical protein